MATRHGYRIPRRGFCLCCLASTGAAVSGVPLTQRQAFAQARNVVDGMRAEAANAPITGHKLRGNISALVGSGGNIAVLTAPDGKVLVDAGMNASRPRITEALGSLGGKPVTHLINTHWHFDHADGNEWLREQGALILAHENTRKQLVEATRAEDWDFSFPPSPAAAVPAATVAANRTLKLDGNTLELKHYGPVHTDGDLSVHFSEADVLHGGDIYWRSYPFIDCSTGGSIDVTIRATEAMLAGATNAPLIVPGTVAWPATDRNSRATAACSSPFARKSRRSKGKAAPLRTRSLRSRPPPSIPSGANGSWVPPSALGWSMPGCEPRDRTTSDVQRRLMSVHALRHTSSAVRGGA